MNIASLIDHSFLKPTATIADIENLCSEAKQYGFRAICIPPLFVKKATGLLKDSKVKIATVTGFPFGYSAIEAKLAETVLAIVDGAAEIDMVINIAALKNADWQWLAKEINTIMPVVKSKGRTMKVILETGSLSDNEIITCCDIYGTAGVDMIKTSTGFAEKGVTVEAVKLLRKHLAEAIKINASGSIQGYSFAKQLLDTGAYCISPDNSIQIVKEATVLN
ncbi:MAG: deoxyribose-phosphate aldolase [Ferruginibacter sp.]